MSSTSTTTRRLFFALWPPPAVREQIAAFQRQLPRAHGRSVPIANLHITLAFIGAVASPCIPCLHRQARQVSAAPFTLWLDRLGHFRKARVLWLGAATPPSANALVSELNRQLVACDYRPETRPFVPHVTLMRKSRSTPAVLEPAPIRWPIEAFYLVESVSTTQGVRYDLLERFPLGGGVQPA